MAMILLNSFPSFNTFYQAWLAEQSLPTENNMFSLHRQISFPCLSWSTLAQPCQSAFPTRETRAICDLNPPFAYFESSCEGLGL
jgi:hypothetical protein